jgi:heme A synthase
MNQERFRTFAWATLALIFAVIVWGAYVRASGSGAGCGSHWPTCNGEILPRPRSIETVVELTHRVTSGLSGILVLIELGWAFLVLPRRHPARAGAVASMVFMLNEGAVGAALVLLEHVAADRSVARAAWTSLHLSNTFFLVAALTVTAYWAPGGPTMGAPPPTPRPRLAGQGLSGALLVAGAMGLLLTGVSGAITALGDTLFTAPSLARGIVDDFSPAAHFLQQLRVLHPIMATFTAVFLLYARGPVAAGRGADAARFSRWLAGLVVTQLVLGVVNFMLRAPVAMQLVHLLVADLVWVVFVLLGAATLTARVPRREGRAEAY